MPMSVFVFRPEDGPAFELWAPREMTRREGPDGAGTLVAEHERGFLANLVVGHNRVGDDFSFDALAARLKADAAMLPDAESASERTVSGTAGEVRIVSFTRAAPQESGRLFQMTACLLSPPAAPERDGTPADGDGDTADQPDERHLVFLTGTCAIDQIVTWEPAFVSAATSLRFE